MKGAVVYEGPNGELFDNLLAAYDYFKAQQCAQAGVADAKLPLTFLQKFHNECCSERSTARRATHRDYHEHSRGLAAPRPASNSCTHELICLRDVGFPH